MNTFPHPLQLNKNLILQASKVRAGVYVSSGIELLYVLEWVENLWYCGGKPKQLKKLFQEWWVPPWLRARVPLIFINDQLAVVVGYAISDLFYKECDSCSSYLIFGCA